MDLLTLTSSLARLEIRIQAKPDGSLEVSPRHSLTPPLREAIQQHKPSLLALFPPEEPDPFDRKVIKDLFDKMAPESPEGFTLAKCDAPWVMDEAEDECSLAIQAKDQPRLLKALIVLEASMRDLFFRFEERRSIQEEDQAPPEASEFTFRAESTPKRKSVQYQTPARIPDPRSLTSFVILPEDEERHEKEMLISETEWRQKKVGSFWDGEKNEVRYIRFPSVDHPSYRLLPQGSYRAIQARPRWAGRKYQFKPFAGCQPNCNRADWQDRTLSGGIVHTRCAKCRRFIGYRWPRTGKARPTNTTKETKVTMAQPTLLPP